MKLKDVPKLPRGLTPSTAIAPSTTSFWFPPDSVEAQVRANTNFTYRPGKMWLGRTATDAAEPVSWQDDRHIVTLAGSRGGKGVSAIIPALCDYPGSVFCLDPKGENARKTAARRGTGKSGLKGMRQEVYVLDPYLVSGVEREYLATFNPLEGLTADGDTALEAATLIADALVVSAKPEDAHFDDSAKNFIEALILHVVSWPAYDGERTLGKVRILLRDGDRQAWDEHKSRIEGNDKYSPEQKAMMQDEVSAFDALIFNMTENEAFEGVISGAASGLEDLGQRERGSVLSTARRNLKFLDAPKMRACLEYGEHAVRLEDLKEEKRGVSIYVVLPARLMKTHSRWMRLLLNLTVAKLEASSVAKPRSGHPVLAILDEFASLSHMQIIENAVGYMAGFGLKIWTILQDISQLKRHYEKSWETFLGNAGVIQCFANADHSTLEFISKRLGEIEVIREVINTSVNKTEGVSDLSDIEKVSRVTEFGAGTLGNSTTTPSQSTATGESVSRSIQKAPLLTTDEIRRFTSRMSGMQVILLADLRPLFLRRTAYYEDPHFKGKFSLDD